MKVVIFEIEGWERGAFEALTARHEVVFERGRLDGDSARLHADAEIISTFIYSALDREVLRALPALRLIATRSTGFDHIALDYCARHGIKVANVPSYGEKTVAEHVFALLLAISHHIAEAVDRTRRGDFSQRGLRGFDLDGKTMGIIGTGSIGRHTARIARGFGMTVLAHDLRPDEEAARTIGFSYASFEEVLRKADVLSLHVPAQAATRHLIAQEEFAKMKDGAVLINTARGSIVDVRALLGALATGKLAAAGLDVLPEEPAIREEAELLRAAFSDRHDLESLLADHILLRLRNVLITPHSAFNTREAVGRILDTTRANIDAFVAGRPANLVA
ncbi:MAG: hydroxyacid dehydrogenase [Reyranellaceae bacterium]